MTIGRTVIYVYYLVAKFVFSKDGWLHCLVDHNSFIQAYAINANDAIKYLYELIPYNLILNNYNRSITSNLIIALSKVGLSSEVINIYNTAFDYTMSRFPFWSSLKIEEAISNNELLMNIEEVFICIYFSRLRLCTTMRVHLILSGIVTLFKEMPDKMIRPIRWFIMNRAKFESSVFTGMLQLLYDNCLENIEYRFQFEDVLKNIYPTNYFIIDYIVEDLFGLDKVRTILQEKPIIRVPISNEEAEYVELMWNSFHPRYHLINYNGFDMYHIMSNLKTANKFRNGLKPDFFYNNFRGISSDNISVSDLLLELVNTDYYSSFKDMDNHDQHLIYQSIKIDVEPIIAQVKSLIMRPTNLQSRSGKYQPIPFFSENKNWVRLGHFEIISETAKKSNDYKINKTKCYGGIIFIEDSTTNIFPYARKIKSRQLFNGFTSEYKLEDAIIFSDISLEQSQLEAMRILWLNPYIVSLLNIKVCEFEQGIFATNEIGDIILKYNFWSSNYYATEQYGGMNYEIPQYLGSELVIEESYFQKICDIYGREAIYYVVEV